MEVHAHTHTQRKKWTHYYWEFLMLFPAVFGGFLTLLSLLKYFTFDESRSCWNMGELNCAPKKRILSQ